MTGVIINGLSHPDVPDQTGWATYYTYKGVQRARQPLDNLNAQVELLEAQAGHSMG